MTDNLDPTLAREIDGLPPPGLLIGHRLITPGDELALTAQERASLASGKVERLRASGAARIVARELLARLGCPSCALVRGPSGAPVWPADITGSLAHDERIAIAAVGRSREAGAVGIDIEPATLLPADMLDLVATAQERLAIEADPFRGRLLFAAKEAVYKAVHPLDRQFLDYHDIEVDLRGARATVSNGRVVELRFCVASHLVALAHVPADRMRRP